MRRSPTFASLVAFAALVLHAPAAGALPATFDCGPDDGRERLTTDGYAFDFEAPHLTAPELASPVPANHPAVTAQRSALFFFRADLAPYRSGDLEISLTWPETSDYDIFVFDAQGTEIARSAASNIDGGDTRFERALVEGIAHCADLSIAVRSWAGRPDQTLSLRIAFGNPGPMFACEKDDPHPACEGKEEGEPPARLPDTRTRLYLGGDRPGQLSMQGHYVHDLEVNGIRPVGGEAELSSHLVPVRPTGGRPNHFTKLVAGNPEQHENPFMANYSLQLKQPTRITGDVKALIWVSSQTFGQGGGGGPLFVDLWQDGTAALAGTRIARVEVPGSKIGAAPTPVRVTFSGVDALVERELVLQVSSEPVAGTSGGSQDPADSEWTIYYDSVQFPAHLTLNLPQA